MCSKLTFLTTVHVKPRLIESKIFTNKLFIKCEDVFFDKALYMTAVHCGGSQRAEFCPNWHSACGGITLWWCKQDTERANPTSRVNTRTVWLWRGDSNHSCTHATCQEQSFTLNPLFSNRTLPNLCQKILFHLRLFKLFLAHELNPVWTGKKIAGIPSVYCEFIIPVWCLPHLTS